MATPIRRLGQVAVPARDVVRAAAFYRDVLGLDFIWGNDRMAFFQLGQTRLFVERPELEGFDPPGSILYYDVADLDGAVAQLEGRGVVFVDRPHHIDDLGAVAVWMAFFHDTEGNLVGLQSERPIPAAGGSGA